MKMNGLPEKLYFLGLGGMGMAPLALYLADRGYRIEGFDDQFRSDVLGMFARSSVIIRNRPSEDTEMLVISRAIREDHELMLWAKERGIPVLTRGEALAHAVSQDRLIAIVGSHGKTTTTAFLIHLMERSGIEFDYVLGGLYSDSKVMPARGIVGKNSGKPTWVVAEVDESDGTIDCFNPEWVLAVDWSWDHPDRYQNAESFDQAFYELFKRTRERIWVPGNKLDHLVSGISARVESWHQPDYVLPDSFPMHGECNARNAAAATAVVKALAGQWEDGWWEGFAGVIRRQQFLGNAAGWKVYQDYAHHPDELNGLFEAIQKRGFSEQPVVVFQPHRYSRTKQFVREFAAALQVWEQVALIPVYSAGEPISMGVEVDAIQDCFPESSRPDILKTAKELELFMEQQTLPVEGREVWFVGAGDIEAKALNWMRRVKATQRWAAENNPFSVPVKTGEMLAGKTTLGVGGAARYYAEPQTRQELLQLLSEAKELSIPVYPLGRGSNLLIMDQGVDGLVIRLRKGEWEEVEFVSEDQVRVGAGVPLKKLCGQASLQGMEGFEFLEGIPGSLGGALRMNAGAMGGWMLDVVDEIEVLTLQGELIRYPRSELHAEYRSCREVSDGFALGALLSAKGRAESEQIRSRISSYSERRKESQPREPSAGCIFKNPEGSHAGKLVDQTGLKGIRVGDAEISRVHGNFMINRGNASSAEVLALINLARRRVREETGYCLEPEVLLWGAKWNEVLEP